MKIKTVIFVIIASLNLIFCKKNDLKSSTFETKEIQTYDKNEGTQYESKDLLVLADLIGILQIQNIDKNSILEYLKIIDNGWKYNGTENEEILFSKVTNDNRKEMISFHYNHNILEYITFNDTHFFRYIKDFENRDFTITNTTLSQYGGNISTFSDGKFKVITEEIPLTKSELKAHKILLGEINKMF